MGDQCDEPEEMDEEEEDHGMSQRGRHRARSAGQCPTGEAGRASPPASQAGEYSQEFMQIPQGRGRVDVLQAQNDDLAVPGPSGLNRRSFSATTNAQPSDDQSSSHSPPSLPSSPRSEDWHQPTTTDEGCTTGGSGFTSSDWLPDSWSPPSTESGIITPIDTPSDMSPLPLPEQPRNTNIVVPNLQMLLHIIDYIANSFCEDRRMRMYEIERQLACIEQQPWDEQQDSIMRLQGLVVRRGRMIPQVKSYLGAAADEIWELYTLATHRHDPNPNINNLHILCNKPVDPYLSQENYLKILHDFRCFLRCAIVWLTFEFQRNVDLLDRLEDLLYNPENLREVIDYVNTIAAEHYRSVDDMRGRMDSLQSLIDRFLVTWRETECAELNKPYSDELEWRLPSFPDLTIPELEAEVAPGYPIPSPQLSPKHVASPQIQSSSSSPDFNSSGQCFGSISTQAQAQPTRSMNHNGRAQPTRSLSQLHEGRAQQTQVMSPQYHAQPSQSTSPQGQAQSTHSISPQSPAEPTRSMSPQGRYQSTRSMSPQSQAQSTDSISPRSPAQSTWYMSPQYQAQPTRSFSPQGQAQSTYYTSPRGQAGPTRSTSPQGHAQSTDSINPQGHTQQICSKNSQGQDQPVDPQVHSQPIFSFSPIASIVTAFNEMEGAAINEVKLLSEERENLSQSMREIGSQQDSPPFEEMDKEKK